MPIAKRHPGDGLFDLDLGGIQSIANDQCRRRFNFRSILIGEYINAIRPIFNTLTDVRQREPTMR
jgi:hypothetical protein